MAPGSWKPLLAGGLADRAREAVTAIAEALAAPPVAWQPAAGEGDGEGERRVSLASGSAGLALLFGYLARSASAGAEARRHGELADLRLRESAQGLASVPMRVGLFGGFTGIAWTTQHLERLLGGGSPPPADPGADAQALVDPGAAVSEPGGDFDEEDANSEVDRALLETLSQATWQGHFDLVTGLAGIGVYALERLPRDTARDCLAAVVDHLARMAVHDENGITWHTRPELLPAHRRREEPLGIFNLGVAHGVPGVIALLADASRVQPCAERARHLLAGAVQWLLAVPRPGRARFRFGKWVSPRTGICPALRLAWCYGDPGIALTLLYAARAAGEAAWERAALDLAVHAARIPAARSGVVDAALCHGAVGLAHLFNRLHQATSEPLFAAAARRWYRRGLDWRQPGKGIAGFCAWGGSSASGPGGWPGDPGLITGAAGIGLGLLAAISDVEPEWDRLLRVAIPPRPAPSGVLVGG